MNDTYFGNRIERSPLGNMGLQLLEAQEKLVSQEYEVENLRIKAAMYKAYFFRDSILAEKLEKQSEEKTVMELKSTLLSITKTCVRDNKCMNDTVTVEELNSLGYINTNLKEKLKNYSEKSYIIYSIKEVYLKR